MRFQVPQFIEFEDKIFGPLTLKQFIYLGGAGGFTVILFILLPSFLAVIISIPIVLLGVALAFYKINNKPFIEMLEAFFAYTFKEKLYIWKKEEKTTQTAQKKAVGGTDAFIPKISNSKLKDMGWNLDIQDPHQLAENQKTGGGRNI